MILDFQFPNHKFFNVAHVGVMDFFGSFFNKVLGAIASIQSSTALRSSAEISSTGQNVLLFSGSFAGVNPASIRIERGGIALKSTDPNAQISVVGSDSISVSGLSNTYAGEQFDLTAIATTKAFMVYSYYNGGVSFIGASTF